MICNIIIRRIQQLSISPQYKQKLLSCVNRIQQKYQSQLLNKPLIIKKICQKYIKICNQQIALSASLSTPLLTSVKSISAHSNHSIQESIIALQFIKSLQFDIYEGKSYQLYVIKISLHLLIVKCFDIKILNAKYCQDFISMNKKKNLYVERLKIFIQQTQKSYFGQNVIKDIYSNIQLIFFQIIRQDFQNIMVKSQKYNMETQLILIEVEGIQKYVEKLFEILKNHILELNEMIGYLEKKVYELLSAKVKLMIQLFQIQSILMFIGQVGEEFSDHQWLIYKKFIQNGGQTSRRGKLQTQAAAQTLKTKKTIKSHYTIQKQNQAIKHTESEQSIFTSTQGGNYNNTSYESCKKKFLDEHLDNLWERYDNVFNKIPNNVDQNQIFQKVQIMIYIFTQNKSKNISLNNQQEVSISSSNNISKQNNKKWKNNSNVLSSFKLTNDKNFNRINGRQNQLSQKFSSQQNNKIISQYKDLKNKQLKDFMNFVTETQNKEFNCHVKESQSKINGYYKINELIHQKNQLQENPKTQIEIKLKSNQSILSDQSNNQTLKSQIDSQSQNKLQKQAFNQCSVINKNPANQSVKKSNFGLLKDMKDVFEYICRKNKNLNPSIKGKQKQQSSKIVLPLNQKDFMNQVCLHLKNDGFKKLNQVKTNQLSILKNIKENQFQRLRRTKSTDIISLVRKEKKDSNYENKNRGKSLSLYFPKLKETLQKNQKQRNGLLDHPKSGTKISSIFIFSEKKTSELKIKQGNRLFNRSKNKKTTLDNIGFGRLQNLFSLKQQDEQKKTQKIVLKAQDQEQSKEKQEKRSII